jgi:hypothetical protein
MATYVDMRNRIADELANDGDITAAQINNAIKDSIKDYEADGFWFNQKVATFSTVAAQELYGAAALADIPNMVRISSMRIPLTEGIGSIEGVANETIEDVQDGSVTGTPRLYSRFENQIRLYPIPEAVQSIKVSYIYKLAELSADGDNNAWTSDCEELIRQAAKKRLCANILLSDEMAARYAVFEKQAYDGVRKENRLREPQQYLRADLPFGRPFYDYTRRV